MCMHGCTGSEEADEVLRKAAHGVDVALNRAKLWTKYTKDIIVYMDKRTSLSEHLSCSTICRLDFE